MAIFASLGSPDIFHSPCGVFLPSGELDLNVCVDGEVGGLCQVTRRAVCVNQAGQKVKVAGTLVFRSLLRFYVEMNAVEGIPGVIPIEFDDFAKFIEQFFTVRARLVGVVAREEGLDVNA